MSIEKRVTNSNYQTFQPPTKIKREKKRKKYVYTHIKSERILPDKETTNRERKNRGGGNSFDRETFLAWIRVLIITTRNESGRARLILRGGECEKGVESASRRWNDNARGGRKVHAWKALVGLLWRTRRVEEDSWGLTLPPSPFRFCWCSQRAQTSPRSSCGLMKSLALSKKAKR